MKTRFAVQNTTFERNFMNVIGCTVNKGKQKWFGLSILLAKTNIFDQVLVQNLCKTRKKLFLKNGTETGKFKKIKSVPN